MLEFDGRHLFLHGPVRLVWLGDASADQRSFQDSHQNASNAEMGIETFNVISCEVICLVVLPETKEKIQMFLKNKNPQIWQMSKYSFFQSDEKLKKLEGYWFKLQMKLRLQKFSKYYKATSNCFLKTLFFRSKRRKKTPILKTHENSFGILKCFAQKSQKSFTFSKKILSSS
jgi:hypothetical protein